MDGNPESGCGAGSGSSPCTDTARRPHRHRRLPLIAAFAMPSAVVGQPAAAAKSNKIPGLRALLDRMDVTGSIMRCQRETAAHITNRGAPTS